MALMNSSLGYGLRIPQTDNHGFQHSEMKVSDFLSYWETETKRMAWQKWMKKKKDQGAEEGGNTQEEES